MYDIHIESHSHYLLSSIKLVSDYKADKFQSDDNRELDDDFNIPSPDFGYFGSQDVPESTSNSQSTGFDIDSILRSSPSKAESERKVVKFLNELTSCLDKWIICRKKNK